jgi:predicted RNase H-like HicB family nuclease
MVNAGKRSITLPRHKGADYSPSLTNAIERSRSQVMRGGGVEPGLSNLTVIVHDEGEDGLWVEVPDLPGCFASGDSLPELWEALSEALGMYLSDDDRQVAIKVHRVERSVEAEPPVDSIERYDLELVDA